MYFVLICLWVLCSALPRAPRDLLRQYQKVVNFFFKSENDAEIRERQNSLRSMQFFSLSVLSPFTGGVTAAVKSAGESQSLAAPYTAGRGYWNVRIRFNTAKREISTLPSQCLLFFNLHYKTGCCVVLLIMAESSNFSSPSKLLNDLWSNFTSYLHRRDKQTSLRNYLAKDSKCFIMLALHFNCSSTWGIVWDII